MELNESITSDISNPSHVFLKYCYLFSILSVCILSWLIKIYAEQKIIRKEIVLHEHPKPFSFKHFGMRLAHASFAWHLMP